MSAPSGWGSYENEREVRAIDCGLAMPVGLEAELDGCRSCAVSALVAGPFDCADCGDWNGAS